MPASRLTLNTDGNVTPSGDITVTTDNRPRTLHSVEDIPAEARDMFDYVTGDDRYDPRLFRFRGEWYDSHEFESMGSTSYQGAPSWVHRAGFDAWQAQSAFDAVLLSYFTPDGDERDGAVVVGYAHW